MKNIFNWLMLTGMAAILLLMLPSRCSTEKAPVSRIDTIRSLAAPETRYFSFVTPTLRSEKTIIYDSTKPTEPLTRRDSDLIVLDYLKHRVYADSLVNDTFKLNYTATVEKNVLQDLKFKYSYRPSITKIIDHQEINHYTAIYVGMAPAMVGNSLSLGVNAGFAWKWGQAGTVADPIRKNYYFYVSKRIGFK